MSTGHNTSGFLEIRSVSWAEVFAIWRANEASNPKWIEHYHQKGFSSWEAWREATHAPLQCSTLEWTLYQIKTPLLSIPSFRAGPFKSWQREYFQGLEIPTFKKLVQHPGLQNHAGLKDLLAHFPQATTITGLITEDGIVVIEGLHRCCAVALAAQQHKPLQTEVQIALAPWLDRSVPELGLG
jgi:hypothetical protein